MLSDTTGHTITSSPSNATMYADYPGIAELCPQDTMLYARGFHANGNDQFNYNSQYSPSYCETSMGQSHSEGVACHGQLADIFECDPSHSYARRLESYFDDSQSSAAQSSSDCGSSVGSLGVWSRESSNHGEVSSLPTSLPSAMCPLSSQPSTAPHSLHLAPGLHGGGFLGDHCPPAVTNLPSDRCSQMTFPTFFSHHSFAHNPAPSYPVTLGQHAKVKRRRIINKEQRTAANNRERKRMTSLNSAFDGLRKRVPTFSYERKLSRIETLKLAMTYIHFMTDVLKNEDDLSSASSELEKAPAKRILRSENRTK